MPLNLIIGRSNSGKSSEIYNQIKQCEIINKRCVVFVPAFARIVAEQEYFKYTENVGMLNTKITTVSRFAEQSITKIESDKRLLPDMSKRFILKKCILDNPDAFKIFNKVKNTEGFTDELYKIIQLFDMKELDGEILDKIYSANNFLSKKFKEIYDIYSKVSDKTKDRFITSIDQMDLLISDIKNNEGKYLEYQYFFDLYNNFNEKELDIIETLLQIGCAVTITIDLDLDVIGLADIFGVSFDTYNKLKTIANGIGCGVEELKLCYKGKNQNMLSHLKQNIFTLGADKLELEDNTVEVKLYKNPVDEIEAIAKDIRKKIEIGEYRYQDFKIYYNNDEMYDLIIKKTFDTYNIPAYISTASKGISTFSTYVVNLAEQLVTGFQSTKTENIIQLLKTGLVIQDELAVDMFENYIREFGIKAYNFAKEFTKNNSQNDSYSFYYDLEKINKIREVIYNGISNLREDIFKSYDVQEYTKKLYTFLLDNKIIIKYGQQLESIKSLNQEQYDRKHQIVTHFVEILDNINLAFEEVDFASYVELLKYGIENIELNSIPPFIDQVEICNIDSARSLPRRQVYIIGVYENGLPIINNGEGIFTDKELEVLKELNVELTKSSEARNSMALFNVYKAINSCDEHLLITVPTTKITGENLRISPIISRIKDIIQIQLGGNITHELEQEKIDITDIFRSFAISIKNIEKLDEQQLEQLNNTYELLKRYERYKQIFKYSRVQENLAKETAEKLYNKDIISSVSRLERFKACPFNYYLNYVLKLKEKKEYRLSSLDLGSIMHKVLEDISKFLLASNMGYQDILDNAHNLELIKQNINESIDSIFDNIYTKYDVSARYAYLKLRLKKGMHNIALALAKSFSQSEFRPFGFEVEFDNGKLFAPIKVELENGKCMYLRGKIDRVDAAKIKNHVYLRVVDYKSSLKDLKLSDVREGLALQLMTYMAALIENQEKIDKNLDIIPAAISYFTLNTDILSFSEYANEEKISEKIIDKMKMKGIYINDIEVLHILDNKFDDPSNSFIDITQRRLSNAEKALTEQEFLEECKNMKTILADIGSELENGCVAMTKTEKSCGYCSYSSICRKSILN